MWETVKIVLYFILMGGGVFFLAVGVIGLLRLPDVFTRLHATTKCDTLGAGLVLLALALQSDAAGAVKLVLITLFIWITNPTGAHVIARSAWVMGYKPVRGNKGYMPDKPIKDQISPKSGSENADGAGI